MALSAAFYKLRRSLSSVESVRFRTGDRPIPRKCIGDMITAFKIAGAAPGALPVSIRHVLVFADAVLRVFLRGRIVGDANAPPGIVDQLVPFSGSFTSHLSFTHTSAASLMVCAAFAAQLPRKKSAKGMATKSCLKFM
jgi:hypothetical protein